MNLALSKGMSFFNDAVTIELNKRKIRKIPVTEVVTSHYELNEDGVFECQHNGDTYREDVMRQGDPENTDNVLICSDCDEIMEEDL